MRTTTGLVLILLAGLLAACAYDPANGPIRTEGSIEMGGTWRSGNGGNYR